MQKLFWIFLLALFIPTVSFSAQDLAINESKEVKLIISKKEEAVTMQELLAWIEIKPYLVYDQEYSSLIENTEYCSTSKVICAITRTKRKQFTIRKENKIQVDKEEVKSFIEDLSRKVNKDPVDAKFTIEDGKVKTFGLSQNGIELETEKNVEIISAVAKNITSNNSKNSVELVYKTIEPAIKTEDVNKLGIDTLIGEGSSNFAGSPKNRIHNIHVATSRFDGKLIKPGEEFSFVNILGPVDGEHGYLPELVIKNNKTEPEFGGGICQVSTTVFRAAVYSGLKITARRNHAYPVQYYAPQGMDATIYIPRPDFRFVNNTSNHILIQTEIIGTKLIFKFYGTNEGRKTEVSGPFVTEKNPDGSMKTYFTQKVIDDTGNVLIDDIFRSSYDSPDNYPHPEEIFTEKPKDWSVKKWKEYKKEHDL